jgi:hypothetical protein
MDEKLPENQHRNIKNGEVEVSRSYLESLTTSDLIKMADNLGVDIPPELDRIFIIEELLDISNPLYYVDNSADTTDSTEPQGEAVPIIKLNGESAGSGAIESAPLPKQYSITFIEVMIRDPLWAFVFWEIKNQDKEQYEKYPDFDGYFLKVSSIAANGNSVAGKASSFSQAGERDDSVFTVTIGSNDNAWYLGFTPARENAFTSGDPVQYIVELCVRTKSEDIILASSNPFILPGLYDHSVGRDKKIQKSNNNQLAFLSGYGDLNVLRYSERLFRAKKDTGAG